jgi:uncharacterized protein YecT (DUF1311 family)
VKSHGIGVFALAMFASSAAWAQTQTDLTRNAVAGAQRADAELTQLYHRLKKTPALVAAERAWIAYRDAECRYEHHATPDGSMYPMESAMCAEAITRDRIEVLKRSLREDYGID